jgi:hypothetical protein
MVSINLFELLNLTQPGIGLTKDCQLGPDQSHTSSPLSPTWWFQQIEIKLFKMGFHFLIRANINWKQKKP